MGAAAISPPLLGAAPPLLPPGTSRSTDNTTRRIHTPTPPTNTNQTQVKPYFSELAATYTDAVFCLVDIDALESVAADQEVTSMPTVRA